MMGERKANANAALTNPQAEQTLYSMSSSTTTNGSIIDLPFLKGYSSYSHSSDRHQTHPVTFINLYPDSWSDLSYFFNIASLVSLNPFPSGVCELSSWLLCHLPPELQCFCVWAAGTSSRKARTARWEREEKEISLNDTLAPRQYLNCMTNNV